MVNGQICLDFMVIHGDLAPQDASDHWGFPKTCDLPTKKMRFQQRKLGFDLETKNGIWKF